MKRNQYSGCRGRIATEQKTLAMSPALRRGTNTGRSPPSAKKYAGPSLFSCNRDEIIYKQLQKFQPHAGKDKMWRRGERG